MDYLFNFYTANNLVESVGVSKQTIRNIRQVYELDTKINLAKKKHMMIFMVNLKNHLSWDIDMVLNGNYINFLV
ncbi:MAG: hypothetical protein FWH29_02650 [Methanobrevibacter sp.]|nr:hypothetical protein [Methanobrevibacter sp.]